MHENGKGDSKDGGEVVQSLLLTAPFPIQCQLLTSTSSQSPALGVALQDSETLLAVPGHCPCGVHWPRNDRKWVEWEMAAFHSKPGPNHNLHPAFSLRLPFGGMRDYGADSREANPSPSATGCF